MAGKHTPPQDMVDVQCDFIVFLQAKTITPHSWYINPIITLKPEQVKNEILIIEAPINAASVLHHVKPLKDSIWVAEPTRAKRKKRRPVAP